MFKNYRLYGVALNGSKINAELYPENYREETDYEKAFHRSVTGRLYPYKINNSERTRYTFTLTSIADAAETVPNSTIRNGIRQFRAENIECYIIFYDSDKGIYYNDTVRITNVYDLFQEYSPHQTDYYERSLSFRDVIEMTGSKGGPRKPNAPFILDDPLFGVLDGTYNLL